MALSLECFSKLSWQVGFATNQNASSENQKVYFQGSGRILLKSAAWVCSGIPKRSSTLET